MLRQRVITAIVLLIILAAVLSSPWPLTWPVFLAVVCGLAVWEWLRMTSHETPAVAWLGAICVTIGLIWQALLWQGAPDADPAQSSLQGSQTLFLLSVALSSAIWLLFVPMKLKHADVHSRAGLPAWGLFAPVCLYATWGALVVWMHQGGIWMVISILALVWIADIFAYFGGKRWGRNKLAPAISPGKTREGALVGLNGVIVWMLVTSQVPGSYAEVVLDRHGWFLLILIAALLGVVSIMGDLFESLLKRQVGIKDSSGLLPGHGGVFDRIDAVVAVIPLAYLITSPSPLS